MEGADHRRCLHEHAGDADTRSEWLVQVEDVELLVPQRLDEPNLRRQVRGDWSDAAIFPKN